MNLFGGKWNKQTGPIGIDVGGHSVKMLQLRRGGQGLKAVAAATAPLPGDLCPSDPTYHEAVGQTIGQMLSGNSFVGNQTVVCLPSASVYYTNLRLPNMPTNEVAAAVQWEGSERLPLGTSEVITQFFHAGEVRQGEETRQEIILIAAADAFIQQYVTTLDQCGLEPQALDVVPADLARCMQQTPCPGQEDSTQLMIDFGYTDTKVLIIRGSRVLFYKSIEIGGKRFNQLLCAQLQITAQEAGLLRQPSASNSAENQGQPGCESDENIKQRVYETIRPILNDLVCEIGLCLRYYSVTFRGRRPESAWLTGGESRAPWLEPMLAQDADVNAKTLDPLANVDLSAIEATLEPLVPRQVWAVAMGLALRNEAWAIKRGAA